MKIAFIVPSLKNKGLVIVPHTIIKNIINKVDFIDLYYFDDDFGLEFPCKTYKISIDNPIDFEKYDIIHSHGYRPDKYVNKWRINIKKAKTVCTIHSDIAQDLKFGYNFLVSLIFTPRWLNRIEKSDAVIVISNKLESLYKGKFKNLYRVYNGVDIDLDESSVENQYVNIINEFKTRNLKVVGTYASASRIKGIDQIVNLLLIRKDLAFVFIGEGKEVKVLVSLAKKLGVVDRVLFFPYQQRPYNYVHLFDIYIMPSRSEGFGLALVEAALTKSAIVCSDIDVFHEIFNDTEVTFFKLEDLNSLNSATSESLLSKETKPQKAYLKAKKYFSGAVMGDNYLELYKKIL